VSGGVGRGGAVVLVRLRERSRSGVDLGVAAGLAHGAVLHDRKGGGVGARLQLLPVGMHRGDVDGESREAKEHGHEQRHQDCHRAAVGVSRLPQPLHRMVPLPVSVRVFPTPSMRGSGVM
jgi:hypothetical protein